MPGSAFSMFSTSCLSQLSIDYSNNRLVGPRAQAILFPRQKGGLGSGGKRFADTAVPKLRVCKGQHRLESWKHSVEQEQIA